jgi:hypothetical protein
MDSGEKRFVATGVFLNKNLYLLVISIAINNLQIDTS